MNALITSCGRFDLLNRTLITLYENQKTPFFLTINEDGLTKSGQHNSIEKFLNTVDGKYYLHCECDWLFENSYDWISESVRIMEADPTIIKVLCRNGSPHPCAHDKVSASGIAYGILEPWHNDGITWMGFSWNPGVTRLDLLKQFIPFGKREQDLAEQIHAAGYKIAELSIPIYTHIGDGRSTPR